MKYGYARVSTIDQDLTTQIEALNKKEDESVSQNLILTSYKLCSSCRVSKTIFPI